MDFFLSFELSTYLSVYYLHPLCSIPHIDIYIFHDFFHIGTNETTAHSYFVLLLFAICVPWSTRHCGNAAARARVRLQQTSSTAFKWARFGYNLNTNFRLSIKILLQLLVSLRFCLSCAWLVINHREEAREWERQRKKTVADVHMQERVPPIYTNSFGAGRERKPKNTIAPCVTKIHILPKSESGKNNELTG